MIPRREVTRGDEDRARAVKGTKVRRSCLSLGILLAETQGICYRTETGDIHPDHQGWT